MRTQAVKQIIHQAAVAETFENARDQDNDYNRGRDQSDGGCDGTDEAVSEKTDIGGSIDADRSGRGFGNRNEVRDIGMREPAGFVGNIIEEGQGGQSAADGKQADFEEFVKQAQEDHAFPPPGARPSARRTTPQYRRVRP